MLMDKLREYAKRFGDGFPMYQLGRSRSDDEIIEIINECLEKGKDCYALGYVKTEDGVLY